MEPPDRGSIEQQGKYQVLSFKTVENKIYPDFQLAKVFFITKELLKAGVFEVQPLTLNRFLRAIIKNFFWLTKWRIFRLFYLSGLRKEAD